MLTLKSKQRIWTLRCPPLISNTRRISCLVQRGCGECSHCIFMFPHVLLLNNSYIKVSTTCTAAVLKNGRCCSPLCSLSAERSLLPHAAIGHSDLAYHLESSRGKYCILCTLFFSQGSTIRGGKKQISTNCPEAFWSTATIMQQLRKYLSFFFFFPPSHATVQLHRQISDTFKEGLPKIKGCFGKRVVVLIED